MEFFRPLCAVKDRDGNVCQTENVLERWREQLSEHLNRGFPHDENVLHNLRPGAEIGREEREIEEGDVKAVVTSPRRQKTLGYDGITAEVIKGVGLEKMAIIVKIFNRVWTVRQTPKAWSKMLITPIYKKVERMNTENHRAISLSSIPGKVV